MSHTHTHVTHTHTHIHTHTRHKSHTRHTYTRHTHTSHTHSLPVIVNVFEDSPDLYEAVRREVCQWKALGSAYFSPVSTTDVEQQLSSLQEQR